ncbi:hypothetical protein CCZ01_02315 [Helicobacter monodelphidis]|uniref:flagellar protein FlaG n=1 Tax=Helicobacter sp. 15-1451 TaxID=2004995 RepID=UPI000DCAF8AC|nr:flagellar protein FlaG [Helicobacter sp. 15-1451]RAX58637.1 hypothetical protein CCZ01_02315 [Helicobacter sp. 15-1451]
MEMTNYGAVGTIKSSVKNGASANMSSIDNGNLARSEGKITNFPKGFSEVADISDEVSEQQLSEMIDEINVEYEQFNLNVSFAYDEDIGALYVEVREIDSGRIIRQIPSEEAINLMVSMRDFHHSLFDFNKEV